MRRFVGEERRKYSRRGQNMIWGKEEQKTYWNGGKGEPVFKWKTASGLERKYCDSELNFLIIYLLESWHSVKYRSLCATLSRYTGLGFVGMVYQEFFTLVDRYWVQPSLNNFASRSPDRRSYTH